VVGAALPILFCARTFCYSFLPLLLAHVFPACVDQNAMRSLESLIELALSRFLTEKGLVPEYLHDYFSKKTFIFQNLNLLRDKELLNIQGLYFIIL
jgi:hypothetical protein